MLNNESQILYHIIITFLVLSVSIYPDWLFASIKDPTKPINGTKSSVAMLLNKSSNEEDFIVLESIFFGKKNKIAIINGEIFREGDTIKNISILSIKKNYVLIDFRKKIEKLTFFKKIYIDKSTGETSE